MASAQLIDGAAHATRLRQATRKRSDAFMAGHGRAPRLDVIIVGNHPASRSYVSTKTRLAGEAAIDGRLVELPETISTDELLRIIEQLNSDATNDGILVQLPLPPHVDSSRVLNAIDPMKDVDGFHPLNVGQLYTASKVDPEKMLIPCTPLGCLFMLRGALGEGGIAGKRAVVIGRSNIVGKPMAQLLLSEDATVTIAHSKTPDLPALCRDADILIAAIGRPGTVTREWVKPGAVIIDVGINRIPSSESGKTRLVGDVLTDDVISTASFVTPVPGGVGPMTVACLLHNTIVAAETRSARNRKV